MILYPDIYLNNVLEIDLELLKKYKIYGLLLDVDNTLIDFDLKIIEGLEEWADNLKNNGIKICILSNTNKIKKVKDVAETIDVPYINFAKKPLKAGFIKGQKLLGLNEQNIAVVGDQIMTDVLGGNSCNMFTILTKPLGKKDIFVTRLKRPLERLIIRGYTKKLNRNRR